MTCPGLSQRNCAGASLTSLQAHQNCLLSRAHAPSSPLPVGLSVPRPPEPSVPPPVQVSHQPSGGALCVLLRPTHTSPRPLWTLFIPSLFFGDYTTHPSRIMNSLRVRIPFYIPFPTVPNTVCSIESFISPSVMIPGALVNFPSHFK